MGLFILSFFLTSLASHLIYFVLIIRFSRLKAKAKAEPTIYGYNHVFLQDLAHTMPTTAHWK